MRRGWTLVRFLGHAAMLCGGLLLGVAGEAAAAIPASERAALIALYDSTNGAGWKDRSNWRNATDTDFAPPGTECTWYGVTCDGSEGHVSALYFYVNALSGPIPSEIGSLPALSSLSLSGNRLTGSIPPEIGNLAGLQSLLLDLNMLSGSIPPEIGKLTALRALSLHSNELTGPIPPQLGSLPDLRTLYLEANRLSGSIPPELGNLFRTLTNPEFLDLNLSYNQLSGSIPPEIGNLGSTRLALRLNDNQLTGTIPAETGNLTGSRALSLGRNQLAGLLPPQVGNLTELLELDVGGNRLSGSIPAWIGNLANLQRLDLGNNQLTGPIPDEIGTLTAAQFLDLSGNQLTGLIPRQVGNLTSLFHLNLGGNGLSGPIPAEIGSLTAVRTLDFSDNQLSGSIPAWIGNLTNLYRLDLSDNQLTGSIPARIGNLSALVTLRLEGNQLTGPIPPALASLPRLDPGSAGDGSDLRWNALYTSDAALRAFLDSKQIGGDWESTQTIAPTGLAAGVPGLDTVALSWSPILYTGDAGGYRLWYGTQAGGPYNLSGTTVDKTASGSAVSGLSPGTTYYFALDTVTEPHTNNQNTVVSARTAEVAATATAGGLGWHGLTVVRDGPGTVSSSPVGIACGGVCSATFAPDVPVTLTAVPEAASTFLGWGGACAGAAPTCDLTMDSVRTVTASFSTPPTSYYTVPPCRVFDSRDAGASGALAAGTDKAVLIAGCCGVPATARAVSLNVTVVSPSAGGHLRLYTAELPRPATSSVNYTQGQTRANNVVVSLGSDGALIVYVGQPSGTVHVVIDVNGYFQ
jgi:Leucine-rich repeat (LRR) protein